MDTDAGQPFTASLDLARMETGPDLQAERPQAIPKSESAAHGARRAVEACEQTVPREVSDHPTEAHDLRARQLVMALEQLTPAGVTQLDRPRGGVDDVSEQHRGEDSVGAM